MSFVEIKSAIAKLPMRQRRALAHWIRRANLPGKPFPEHSRVRLCAAIPAERLRAGARGTVVHIYADGDAYEVEFTHKNGVSAVLTLEAHLIAAVGRE